MPWLIVLSTRCCFSWGAIDLVGIKRTIPSVCHRGCIRERVSVQFVSQAVQLWYRLRSLWHISTFLALYFAHKVYSFGLICGLIDRESEMNPTVASD
jgi:hypothetical protein